MTPRSIRRAAERKARKLARKAEKQLLTQATAVTVPDLPPPAAGLDPDEAALLSVPKAQMFELQDVPPLTLKEAPPFSVPKMQKDETALLSVPKIQAMSSPSPARLAANRANAKLSTGPRTSTGKEVCSLNVLKTGLTGRTVLLPSEDAEEYRRHIDRFFAEYKPADDKERDLVQTIADTGWRLLRISVLETNLFALGRVQFRDMFQDEAAELRPALIEAHTLVAFQKQFVNLGIQEARLLRRFEKTRAELVEIQTRRHAAKSQPAAPNPKSVTDRLPPKSCGLAAADPVGSEFSTPRQSAPKYTGAEDQPLTPEHKAIVEAAVARFAAKSQQLAAKS